MPRRSPWSSMGYIEWMPDASFASPRPSRARATNTCVSLVSRWISALRMGSGEDRAKGVDEALVFGGGADREAKGIREKWVRPVECPDQYTTLHQGVERARTVGHAHQDEVGRRGKALDAGDRIERGLEGPAVGDDAPRLLLQDVAMLEQELARRR